MKYKTLFYVLFLLLIFFYAPAQNYSLEKNVSVFACDTCTIQTILNTKSIDFKPRKHLNFGICYTNQWLKFDLINKKNVQTMHYLCFESSINDSLVLFKIFGDQPVQVAIIGERVDFYTRKIKHRNPILAIDLKPNESARFYLHSIANGQPLNLAASILDGMGFHAWDVNKAFFLGFVYGILFLVVLLNLSYYFITNEYIYVLFTLQILATILTLATIDGFVYQYVFPKNSFWSNQCASLGMCLTFIFHNQFAIHFFNLKTTLKSAYYFYQYATLAIFLVLVFSFYHPFGFNFFIIFMTFMTSLIAVLLFSSILTLKKRGFAAYAFAFLATISLIVFGTIFQLFILGLEEDNFFTHHSMHFTVVFQSIFLALAVNDKFREIRNSNNRYQQQMVENLNTFSQKLISTIEAERQRMAVDIHDSLGQNLLVMRNKILTTLKKTKTSEEYKSVLKELIEYSTTTLDEARAMSYNLRPPILNTHGLSVAIEALVRKIALSSSFKIDFEMPQGLDGLLAKDLEINIYRILQEIFNNAIKHAQTLLFTLIYIFVTKTLN